jgi:hypothetical protein
MGLGPRKSLCRLSARRGSARSSTCDAFRARGTTPSSISRLSERCSRRAGSPIGTWSSLAAVSPVSLHQARAVRTARPLRRPPRRCPHPVDSGSADRRPARARSVCLGRRQRHHRRGRGSLWAAAAAARAGPDAGGDRPPLAADRLGRARAARRHRPRRRARARRLLGHPVRSPAGNRAGRHRRSCLSRR